MASARPAASEGWLWDSDLGLCLRNSTAQGCRMFFYPIPRVKMHSVSLLVKLPGKMRRGRRAEA
jgi:hypothetical protein